MKWAVADTTFSSDAHLNMDKAHLEAAHDPMGITYEDMATLASRRVSDLIDAANPNLGWAKASGVKMISWTGTADRNIHPRNSIDYYRRVAEYSKRMWMIRPCSHGFGCSSIRVWPTVPLGSDHNPATPGIPIVGAPG